jgi:regulator of RNase E activity RraA
MGLTEDQRQRLEQLHTAIIGDVTDEMGIEDNMIPCMGIESLWGRPTVVGTAKTIQVVEIGYERDKTAVSGADRVGLQALESIENGDMVVRAAPEGVTSGQWGELLSTAAMGQGAVGAVIDGPTRDSRMIEDHGFPVWCRGHSNIESWGRTDIREFDVPVEIEGVTINPGDVVMADYESVAVLPPEIVDDVLEEAEADYSVEEDVRADLREGRSVIEVWDDYETL